MERGFRKSASEDGGAFFFVEFLPFADGEIAEGEGADALAHEAEAGEADGGSHAADLAVFAFAEFEAEPGVDDFLANPNGGITVGDGWGLLEGLGAAGHAAVTLDDEGSAAELGEGGFVWDAFDEDEVAAAVGVAGVEELVFERFFVGEEEESFGVHVEAAEGEALGREVEFLEGALSFVAGVGVELAEDAERFVEGNEHGLWREAKAMRLGWSTTDAMKCDCGEGFASQVRYELRL